MAFNKTLILINNCVSTILTHLTPDHPVIGSLCLFIFVYKQKHILKLNMLYSQKKNEMYKYLGWIPFLCLTPSPSFP